MDVKPNDASYCIYEFMSFPIVYIIRGSVFFKWLRSTLVPSKSEGIRCWFGESKVEFYMLVFCLCSISYKLNIYLHFLGVVSIYSSKTFSG